MWLRAHAERPAGGQASTSGGACCCDCRHRLAARPPAGPRASRGPRVVAAAAGGSKRQQQQQQSRRNAQLYELGDDDGWGVDVRPPPPGGGGSGKAAPQRQPQQVTPPPAQATAPQRPAAAARKGAGRRKGTPYVAHGSEEGVFGLTLLQRALLEQEEQQQAQGEQPGAAPLAAAGSLQAVKDSLATAAAARGGGKRPKLPGLGGGGAAAAAAAARQQQMLFDDGGEDEEDAAVPEFQITFEGGRTEITDFSSGRTISSSTAAAEGGALGGLGDDRGMSGWEQFDSGSEALLGGGEDEWGEDEEGEGAPGALPGRWPAAQAEAGDDGGLAAALLADLSNEDDWGLDGLALPGAAPPPPQQQRRQQQPQRRRSLLDQLAEEEAAAAAYEEGSLAAGGGGSVQWGGSAGTTGIDLEEQEEVLRRYFRPDQVKRLMRDQVEIDDSYSELRKRAVGLGVSDHKLQEKLRIVAGSAAGCKLVSFRSAQTRPMMAKVRQAIFSMLQSRAGTLGGLPRTARWLDLFAGTGSVGLEALSRGAAEAHFVEMDQAVVSRVLRRNISACGFARRATTHTSKAEDFLRRAAAAPRFAGGPFDFVSVCPPYLLVSYPELFDLLDASPLLHEGSVVFVEYPKQLSHEVRDRVGPLAKVRDRRYGRTYVAVYGGAGEGPGGGDDEEEDPFLSGGL